METNRRERNFAVLASGTRGRDQGSEMPLLWRDVADTHYVWLKSRTKKTMIVASGSGCEES